MSKEALILPSFKRENLVEMVFETLKKKILTAEFKDGERLPTQEQLCRHFGVSRTVLLGALHKLSSLGLITSYQGRGTFVHVPNTTTVMKPVLNALVFDENSTRELLEARYYLESVLVRLAATQRDTHQLHALQEIVELMEHDFRNGDLEDFAEHDLKFHLTLADISKNSILKQIVEVIREMLLHFLENFNRVPGAAERAIRYHREIFQAVSEKNADRAEREMQQHLLDVMAVLRQQYMIDVDPDRFPSRESQTNS